jgi:hypothetical protein
MAEKLRSVAASLGTFTLTDPTGFELSFDFGRAEAPAEKLSDDFADLLLAVATAAQERGRGVVCLLDEVQFLHPDEFGPFVIGLHRIDQKASR